MPISSRFDYTFTQYSGGKTVYLYDYNNLVLGGMEYSVLFNANRAKLLLDIRYF
jgi:hypothetical protein